MNAEKLREHFNENNQELMNLLGGENSVIFEMVINEIVKLFAIPDVSVMCECAEKSINHVGPFYKECGKCGKQIK